MFVRAKRSGALLLVVALAAGLMPTATFAQEAVVAPQLAPVMTCLYPTGGERFEACVPGADPNQAVEVAGVQVAGIQVAPATNRLTCVFTITPFGPGPEGDRVQTCSFAPIAAAPVANSGEIQVAGVQVPAIQTTRFLPERSCVFALGISTTQVCGFQ